MKLYLEIIEDLTEEELLTKQPQVIRIEVKDKDEALGKLKMLEPLFANRNYRKQLHYCYHDENKPCSIEEL